MAERTILVTGSTDGIGEATARELSRQGHRVLLHGRNPEKGRKVLAELEENTGADRLDLFIADLSVQEQVMRLAEEVAGAYDRLDVLINNAGVFMPERAVAPGGIEMTFAVNFLSQVLLAHELLGLLERSAPARIVNVASIAHRSARSVDWGNLPGFPDYDAYDAYAVSKLGVVAFTARLARTLEGTGVTANSLHPGVIDTKLLRAYTGGRDGGAPPEKGAEVEVHLALSPDAGETSGGYFEENRWKRPSSLALDAGVQEQFWEMGSSLTGAVRWADPKAYAR
ncbi:SDR family NAD(P)-dependent oxidoreductase [Methanoculleus sp. Afa-1]|uniref:SDR family NAD(P)-dependent oxidoreductase n=1 Tax=Methanoculleus formosensis TaxID=2590886 RepID=A0A9E4ZNN7_9EURY|nr:SDR family NAD(P)-dependent oxidoreductase [Methanoculleus sp. Afa-1]MCT8337546.1 SDR family NAD(P)-dependent oxidoreductase [Methanoculleus sp. Afa-1]